MPAGMDFQALLEQAQRMQQDLAAAQADLAAARVRGTAGGGLVTATLSGDGELVELEISPGSVDLADADALEMLADLVVAAVRDAREQSQRLAAERIDPLTHGLGDAGGGLGGLLGGGAADQPGS